MSLLITETLVRKLLAVVDAGLVAGLGSPEPGKMCVEAAISYALGEPHSDGPSCVDAAVRAGKIILNDCAWSSDTARASGMRQVAIAQLGSKGIVDPRTYVRLLAQYTIDEIVPFAATLTVNAAYAAKASVKSTKSAKSAKSAAHTMPEVSVRYAVMSTWFAAEAAAYAADIDTDLPLRLSAQLMVRALQECGSPGCNWLWLCEEEAS